MLKFNELSDGMQILVDGVPAVVMKTPTGLRPFSPGTSKPMSILGSFVVGQWSDAFLQEQEYWIWNKSHASLCGSCYRAIGGSLKPRFANEVLELPSSGYNHSHAVRLMDACINNRVELNDKAETHIDVKAWDAAFERVYSES